MRQRTIRGEFCEGNHRPIEEVYALKSLAAWSDNTAIPIIEYAGAEGGFSRMGVAFVAAITEADEVIIGYVANIALDGVYVRLTDETIIDDEFVTVRISREGAEEGYANFQGRVMWIDRDGVAIQFRPMTLENQDRLLEIMFLVGEQNQTRGGYRKEATRVRAF